MINKMTKRILILNPPSPDADHINRDLMGGMGVKNSLRSTIFSRIVTKLKNTYVRIPVLQLVYAATILKKAGFQLLVIDAATEDLKLSDIKPKIKEFNPNYVVMACSASCFIFERDVVAKEIKGICPDVKIIVEGEMINEKPELLLPHFDVGILGEIENSIVKLCSGHDLKDVQGIAYAENNEIKKTAPANKLEKEQLEELPFPDWSLFPYKKYSYYPMVSKMPLATIQSSKGCPYGCGYCPYPANQGLPWRARDAKNIFEEMRHDYEKFGIKGFFFRDPLFSLNQKRVEELCNLIIESKLDFGFAFETRPELLKKELIGLLAKAGCECINLGVEDIHPEILKLINRRPIDTEKILETVRLLHKAGIRTSCFFILGLPGSTKQTIKETVDFSLKLLPSQVEYKIATPFPGTQLYEMAKSNNWLKSETLDLLGGYSASMQISNELTQEYIEGEVNNAFNRFYFSPRFLLREIIKGRFIKNISFLLRHSL